MYVLRVKRKRCEDPLDQLVIERVARRAHKRPMLTVESLSGGGGGGTSSTAFPPFPHGDGEVSGDGDGDDAPESPRLAVMCRVETVDVADASRPSTNRRVLRKIKRRIAGSAGGASSAAQRWHDARHPTAAAAANGDEPGGGRMSAQSAASREKSRVAHAGRVADARSRSMQQRRRLAAADAASGSTLEVALEGGGGGGTNASGEVVVDGESERVTFVDFDASSARRPPSESSSSNAAPRDIEDLGAVPHPTAAAAAARSSSMSQGELRRLRHDPAARGSSSNAVGGSGNSWGDSLSPDARAAYDMALTEVEARMDAAIKEALESSSFSAVFEAITRFGADVNYAQRGSDNDHSTALIVGARCGDTSVVRHLLDMGAEVMLCDRHGYVLFFYD